MRQKEYLNTKKFILLFTYTSLFLEGFMESRTKLLFSLFWSFFKIGAFTFGGGYAMLPIMHKEVTQTHHWISDEETLDMMAIAESTPGAFAINMATFTGYKVAGTFGSACATFGVVLPSFIIISVLSYFITQFKNNPYVAYAFSGIRIGVVVLVANAVIKLSKKLQKTRFNYIFIIGVFILSAVFDIDTVLLLLASALCGILYHLYRAKREGGALK